MHRLFVGLRPPAPVRALLLGAMGGVPGARWQSGDQLHLTLRFIGEVEAPTAEDLAAALLMVRGPPVSVAVAGVGRFERRGRTHTLWAGLAPHDPLSRLHRRIDGALVDAGLAGEARSYLPHVTLARMNADEEAVARFLMRHATLASAPFTIDHFLLYESRLGRDGARYEAVARYPLSPR